MVTAQARPAVPPPSSESVNSSQSSLTVQSRYLPTINKKVHPKYSQELINHTKGHILFRSVAVYFYFFYNFILFFNSFYKSAKLLMLASPPRSVDAREGVGYHHHHRPYGGGDGSYQGRPGLLFDYYQQVTTLQPQPSSARKIFSLKLIITCFLGHNLVDCRMRFRVGGVWFGDCCARMPLL